MGCTDMNPTRWCWCRAVATRVARDVDGLQWYACDAHRSSSSVEGDAEVTSMPIGEFFERVRQSAEGTRRIVCPACGGRGVAYLRHVECSSCEGAGEILVPLSSF